MNINVAIIINKKNVTDARKKKNKKRHLIKETFENSQSTNAKCFSNNSHDIWCSCVDLSSINHLDSYESDNLIVESTTLIFVWLKKIDKYMIKNNSMFSWQSRYAYNISMNDWKLHKNDLDLLQSKINWNDKNCSWKKSSKFLIVVINFESYKKHINNVFATWNQFKRQRKKSFFFKIRKLFDFDFDRVIVDEAHFENTKNVITITLMRILNEKMQESWSSRKWFLIDISFERDSKQIVYWIETLQDNNNIWINSEFFNDWNIDNDYLKKLKNCTCQRLL